MERVMTKQICVYCEGIGYFQLLLGGSDTCVHCAGTGIPAQHHRHESKKCTIDPIDIRVEQKLF